MKQHPWSRPEAKMRVCAASTEGPVGRMRVTEEDSIVATASLAQHVLALWTLRIPCFTGADEAYRPHPPGFLDE